MERAPFTRLIIKALGPISIKSSSKEEKAFAFFGSFFGNRAEPFPAAPTKAPFGNLFARISRRYLFPALLRIEKEVGFGYIG
jgi:hypothetical protein